MKSMTGYGKGVAASCGRKVVVEIKAVNNRFLEINTRLPKNFMVCDEVIRSGIQARIKRGTLDVYFSYENNADDAAIVELNLPLAQKLTLLAREAADSFKIKDDFDCAALFRFPDVIRTASVEINEEAFSSLTQDAVTQALDSLEKMRFCEGESIRRDLDNYISDLEAAAAVVLSKAGEILDEYRQKIYSRVKEILASVDVDENKLLNEVAFFADKSDIGEELSRLNSHFTQFRECLSQDEAVGRKLDFISQEINREINTIASKSSDLVITNVSIEMKNTLEKIREQIRNVE